MKWNSFEDKIHKSWHEKLRPFIESEDCDKIYERLKFDSKRGKTIAPLSPNVWRCFKETSLDDLKVVLMGLCPYHTLYNGSPVADGLLAGKLVVCSDISVIREQMEAYGISDGGPIFFCPESVGAISAAAESALRNSLHVDATAQINQAKLRSRVQSLWEEWADFYCASIESML